MLKSHYNYSELVIGGYKGKPRNNVISFAEFSAHLNGNKSPGCYRSHFRFTRDYQDYVKKTGSVKGYSGSAHTDFLWVDIDNTDKDISTAVGQSLETAKIYINRLNLEYDIPPEHLRCFFSGRKGFHIGIPSEVFDLKPCKEIPQICKTLAQKLAGDLGYDPGIYDRTRLFRLANTQHEESKLYKVELGPAGILQCGDPDKILALAKEPRSLERDYDPEDSYGVLAHLVEQPTSAQVASNGGNSWVTALLKEGATSGSRTHSVTRLAGYFKAKGLPEDIALLQIQQWDIAKNDPPLAEDPQYPQDKLEKTVADIYKYPGEPVTEPEISQIKWENWVDSHQKAPAYISDMNRTRIRFGYPQIDAESSLLGAGETAIMVAYVGVGKTAWAQSVQLDVAAHQKLASVMFSLEMSAMRLYFRQAAMIWGYSPKEVEEMYMTGRAAQEIHKMAGYENTFVVDYVPMSVPLMADIIKQSPVDIDLVFVDYVGLLTSKEKTPYERMTKLSRDLATMAKELKVALVCIYQTNRMGQGGEITLAMARDSGMIEANCDMALGLWIDETNRDQRKIRLLKARHGKSGATETLGFFGNSPKLYSLEGGYNARN